MKHLLNWLALANPAFWYFLVGALGSAGVFIYILVGR